MALERMKRTIESARASQSDLINSSNGKISLGGRHSVAIESGKDLLVSTVFMLHANDGRRSQLAIGGGGGMGTIAVVLLHDRMTSDRLMTVFDSWSRRHCKVYVICDEDTCSIGHEQRVGDDSGRNFHAI